MLEQTVTIELKVKDLLDLLSKQDLISYDLKIKQNNKEIVKEAQETSEQNQKVTVDQGLPDPESELEDIPFNI